MPSTRSLASKAAISFVFLALGGCSGTEASVGGTTGPASCGPGGGVAHVDDASDPVRAAIEGR